MPATDSAPTALITGAGSGIGLAAAHALARRGYRLLLVARTASTLDDAARAITARSPSAAAFACPADLARPDQAQRVVATALDRFGRVDALINNAGVARVIPIEHTTDDDLAEHLALNLYAPLRLVRALWPIWSARRTAPATAADASPCVVNVSSVAVFDPFPGFTAYAASKAAVNALTRSIHNERAPTGVRAFSVCPGAVETPLLRSAFDTQTVPESMCLSPDDVGTLIADCITGAHDDLLGKAISIVRTPAGVRTAIEAIPSMDA